MLLVLCVAGIGGCTRAFYRNSADREVNDILKEKDKYPDWKIEQYHVYCDPRARFANPGDNPDRPQMPPDDEAAWKLSPHSQKPGHKGTGVIEGTGYLEMIKLWDAQNRAAEPGVNNVEKRPLQTYFNEALNADPKGFLVKMDQAIELGVINSPTYQSFREELYLAALPVTQQRFNFAYQWAATSDWFRQYAGPLAASGPENNWTGASSIGFSKLFATGALLTTDFVNTTAFNFGANGGLTSQSVVNLNFAQPLLQGGGKAVTLEPLNQSERTLLYSIRAFARFREQFNVSVALGTTPPSDLQTAAGATFTNPISVLAALGIASTDVSGGFVGYLSTLYRECDMAADKKWVQDLKQALKTIEAYQEGDVYSQLQVEQVRSTLLNAQNAVLTDYQFVTNAVDQFKLVLGLPANLPLILDDTPARPITGIMDRYYEVVDDARVAQKDVDKLDALDAQKVRGALAKLFAEHPLMRGTQTAKELPGSWAKWVKTKDADLAKGLEDLKETERGLLLLKAELGLKKPPQTLSDADTKKMRDTQFEYRLGLLEKELRRHEIRPWERLEDKKKATVERVASARTVSKAAKGVLVWARNDRLDALTTEWPEIPPSILEDVDLLNGEVEMAQEKAVQAALRNRWDLMNARAQVVDAWRQIAVTANALLGVATVEYNLTSQTPPNGVRPLVFSAASTNQQLLFNWQLPINRLAQRNAYRAAQIQYQVARRNLMFQEDNVAVQVRFDVRQLQLFAANYRFQKKIIHSVYGQLENNLEIIESPTDPSARDASGTFAQVAAAALVGQYLTALGQLNNAQTKMYDIWLSLYATRMQLYLDLERLPMDRRGVWTDDTLAPYDPSRGQTPSAPNAPPVVGQRLMPPVQGIEPAAGDVRPMFLAPRVVSDARKN